MKKLRLGWPSFRKKVAVALPSSKSERRQSHEISRFAAYIEAEIQSWIDRETIVSLTSQLRRVWSLDLPPHEESLIEENLINVRDTLAKGFDLSLQDLLL
nr:Armadillo-like helical [Ipomoea batatas]